MRTVINGLGGVKTVIQLESDGSLTTGTVQDCTAIAEHCKAMHNEGHTGSKDMRLAAKLPEVLVEKYCNDNGITFRDFLRDPAHARRMVQDPANDAFRIWKGAL